MIGQQKKIVKLQAVVESLRLCTVGGLILFHLFQNYLLLCMSLPTNLSFRLLN
jgi:hypothetical protein